MLAAYSRACPSSFGLVCIDLLEFIFLLAMESSRGNCVYLLLWDSEGTFEKLGLVGHQRSV